MSTVSPQLRSLLLTHWKTYHPTMYQELVREGTLEAHLKAIAEQWCDLMYDLVTVKGMDYAAAREIAVNQFLLPEEDGLASSDSTIRSQPDLHETSE
jgi:hypothetical protein